MWRCAILTAITACGRFDFGPYAIVDGDTTFDACAASPAPIPTTIVAAHEMALLAITNIDVDGGGQLVRATPGAALAVTFDYVLRDTSCAALCIDQIELGFTPGTLAACATNGPIDPINGVAGTISGMAITAPVDPGAYELRANISEDFACGQQYLGDWFGGHPPPNEWAIAKLCVASE